MKQGVVGLERMNLHKVLYVPDLSCNLISVARVSKEFDCTLTFFDNFCVLQDRTSKILIAVGEQ